MYNIKNIEAQLKAAILADANRPSEAKAVWHRAVNVVMHNNRLHGDDLYLEIMDLINGLALPSQEELEAADKLHRAEEKKKKERYLALVEECKRREEAAAAEVEPWDDAEAFEYV